LPSTSEVKIAPLMEAACAIPPRHVARSRAAATLRKRGIEVMLEPLSVVVSLVVVRDLRLAHHPMDYRIGY
jgi:hypothetical protein